MSGRLFLVELLLAGFFAIACARARVAASPNQKMTFAGFFRLTDRLERIRRSRWQWFAMVALVLALRVQHMQPLALEFILVVQFLIFLALPTRPGRKMTVQTR